MKYVIAVESNMILVLDKKSNVIVEVELNITETLVLNKLVISSRSVVSRNELINSGWPGRVATNNSLNVLVKKLRDKLTIVNENFSIRTIPTKGYVLSLPYNTSIESIESVEQLNSVKLSLGNKIKNKVHVWYKRKYTPYILFVIPVVILCIYLSGGVYSSLFIVDSNMIKCSRVDSIVTCTNSDYEEQ